MTLQRPTDEARTIANLDKINPQWRADAIAQASWLSPDTLATYLALMSWEAEQAAATLEPIVEPANTLHELQAQCAAWAFHAFPDETVELRALGLAEEAGELCRALLKRANGIRGTREEWDAEVKKEAGDVLATLLILASYEDFDLFDVAVERFAVVSTRDLNHDPVGSTGWKAGDSIVGPCPDCGEHEVRYTTDDTTEVECAHCKWRGYDEDVLGVTTATADLRGDDS